MVFSSIFFLLFFLPVFLTGYTLLRGEGKNHWLLIFSLLFYGYGAPEFIWVLLGSSLVNFYLVHHMHRHLSTRPGWAKALLWAGIVLNVGLLLVYKYANFVVDVGRNWGAWELPGWVEIALPIGISFFTFQSLSYNLDIYRGQERPLRNPLHYLIYIFSFPQMIAGPIVRYGAVAAELVQRPFTRTNIRLGAQRFVVGLAKKVLIANTVAAAFPITEVEEWTTLSAWAALLAYTVQIYFDFSGYSDMAIGLGRMMGFHFPENFNRPYNARSFTDFWRRWHMTLSFWMRDYLYIGLGGNRKGAVRTYANLLVVFTISGFWHGASWNFLFWGLYHGFFLVIERLFLSRLLARLPKVMAQIWTLFFVVLGWALFAIVDDIALGQFLSALFSTSSLGSWGGTLKANLTLVVAAVLIAFPAYNLWARVSKTAEGGTRSFMWHALLGVWTLAELAGTDFNPFIYFRF